MNILVAFDASDESRAAAKWAARLAAGEPGSTVTVVGVVQMLEMAPATRDNVDPTVHPERLEKAIEDVAALIRTEVPEARIETRLLAGNPAEQILDAGDGTDIIVLGKSGSHAMRRFLIGTVVERVARHSKRPVLIAQ